MKTVWVVETSDERGRLNRSAPFDTRDEALEAIGVMTSIPGEHTLPIVQRMILTDEGYLTEPETAMRISGINPPPCGCAACAAAAQGWAILGTPVPPGTLKLSRLNEYLKKTWTEVDVADRAAEEVRRRVARTDLPNGDHVSTVLLHGSQDGAPEAYETLVTRGPHEGMSERHATRREAERAHRVMVDMLSADE